jgi:RNA polymerase sigma-70 factor (ECF subfamily)
MDGVLRMMPTCSSEANLEVDPLDAILDTLCRGNAQAAEQAFLAYEPYLRKVVRRMLPQRLRPKFDSADVVQSVWGDVLQGFRDAGWRFADAAHLRAFLVQATRHRFIDRVRHYRKAAECESPLGFTEPDRLPPSAQPRPSELAQADDLWDRILALCPPEHHELLRLKRCGLASHDIAERTGLHEGSIRRILRGLARRLAASQPNELLQQT